MRNSKVSTRFGSARKMSISNRFAVRLLPSLAVIAMLASPAQAQFSDSYKFLEAVRKKEGEKVETALAEPGSTIVNTRDVSTGRTALHIVSERRDIVWLRYLIAKGANVNIADKNGTTPLQVATGLGWNDGAEELVAAKAQVDQPTDAGETPLIAAVHQRNTALMRILLEAGANPDRADNSGRSARDYAMLEGGNSQVVNTITTYAKKTGAQKATAVYGPTLP